MLTKTKKKKDKVSELLHRKKKSFPFLSSSFAEIGLCPILISHPHVPTLFSSGEIFLSDVAEGEGEIVKRILQNQVATLPSCYSCKGDPRSREARSLWEMGRRRCFQP
jgi:hypothetical protein